MSRRILKFCRRNKSLVIGGVIISFVLLVALFAPLIAPTHYSSGNIMVSLTPPGKEYLFGTDQYGRDVLSRIIYGARISLAMGVIIQTMNTFIGVSLGFLAGYYGGKIDAFVVALTNIMLSLPPLVIGLAIVAVLGPGISNVFIALGVTMWTHTCRVTRAETMSIKSTEFVDSARALGSSTLNIMGKHILPNIAGPILVIATLGVADAILVGASLSFLGVGAQPPLSEWGAMLSRGRDYLYIAPWLMIFPGLALFVAIFGLNLLGDGLRDYLDPHLKTKQYKQPDKSGE